VSQIKKDFSGAFHKTAVLKRTPKAEKHIVTQWATDTVMMLKKRAASMQKSGKGRKTGQLARNIGMESSVREEDFKIIIGTGVGRTQSVIYAKIQDEGGTTKAHIIKPRNGKVLAFTVGSETVFARVVHHPGSKIPASRWFSGIIEARAKDLAEAMKPEHALKVAEGMAAGENV
jgi:hypothetical protein